MCKWETDIEARVTIKSRGRLLNTPNVISTWHSVLKTVLQDLLDLL